ncbi:uncharacterized protein LOC132753632 [Ruditapes philippinarum]|uniref:uncharacterized protein LOC132753632 n=1 Tax=Ruditapes philippinarum TaxID=129788 RepID=UPI00295BCF5D|nr:uncharacterized protein LOC132753632 [Ruditapes philippinarum]
MEGGHLPSQPNPQFGYVQNSAGVHYGTANMRWRKYFGSNLDTGQNLPSIGHSLHSPGQTLSPLGQNLSQPRQNLLPPGQDIGQNVLPPGQSLGHSLQQPGHSLGHSLQQPGHSLGHSLQTPGHNLPPPPPLVRHGHTSSTTASQEEKFNAAIENHFRRSLKSYPTTNIPSRNVNTAPPSMGVNSMGNNIGASMGTSSIPNQSNTRFGYPGPTSAQQYGQNWRGSIPSAMRHPVAMARVQGDPLIRQALGHKIQQDKQINYPVNQGQGHFPGQACPQYRYPGLANQMNALSSVQGERIDPIFANNSFRMPNTMTQNRPSVSQSNFAPNFTFTQMQRPQNYSSTANQYSMNPSLPVPPPAHQNVPKMLPTGYPRQPGPMHTQSQGHSSIPRQSQTSSSYPTVSQSLGNYGMGSLPGHMTQGQVPMGMAVGQGYQGQNPFNRNQQTISQEDIYAQRQNLFQTQNQQPTGSVSGSQGLDIPVSWQNAKLAGVVQTIANLANLSDSSDSEAKRKLMKIKEKCQRSGLLGPNESFPAFLAKYAIRERNRILGEQQSQPLVNSPSLTAQTSATAIARSLTEPMRGVDNASAIHSAFAIPQSNDLNDRAALGRWYAAPSAEMGMSTQIPITAGSSTLEKNIEQTVAMATVTTPADFPTNTSTSASQATEPFVLRPTVCTEEVIEYKVADLLRCLPKSVRAQIAKNMEAEKGNEQTTVEPNKDTNHECSGETGISDRNGQQEIPVLPMYTTEPSVEESENVEMRKSDLREGTESSDEQLSKTDSFFDINKRVSDELVLDYQFGTQDMDPDIDFRNYLPELHLPTDISATPSPMLPEMEIPSHKEQSLTDNELNVISNDATKELPIHFQNELEDNSSEVIGEKDSNMETEELPEPTVEIDRDEVPVLLTKKRKHSSISDSYSSKPPVKRARGRGRGGHTRGRGKNWASSITPRNKKKQNKPTRGMKAGGTHRGRGRGKRVRARAIIETDESSATNTEHERSESPSISGLDGQVIQKPQDLKTLMDNLPHEELEKTTVSLSTLKMMLAWTEAKANAGFDEEDQESDNDSVNSATGDTKNVAEDMDVMSEVNNKEHNQYEPPVDDINEKLDKEIGEESNSEEPGRTEPTREKQKAETELSAKVLGNEEKDTSSHTEINKNINSDEIKEKISEQSEEAGREIKLATDESIKENTTLTQKETDPSDSDKSENKISDTESRSCTQVYSVTDTHKMTWVRYHGKTVTRLITPDGYFFIMKEILRRCFRIQEPNKSLKFSKIGILKRKVLKIPDIELAPLFYDYVVKNLVERKVIKTIPDKFIIISEVDANRLFHFVCKDQYCGNSCVTPFFQNTASSSEKQSETSKESQTKMTSKKDRNLFDFIESETVSPKSSASKASMKKKRLSSSECINLCSDDEKSNGYDSDRTLPYVDGKPLSYDEIKGTKSLTEKTKTIVSELVGGSDNLEQLGKTESKSDKTACSESQDIGSQSKTLDTGTSGQERTNADTVVDLPDVDLRTSEEHLQERNKENLSKTGGAIDTEKSTGEMHENVHDTSAGSSNNESPGAADDVIVIDEEDEEANVSFSGSTKDDNNVCQLTLDKMKKELGIRGNFGSNKKEKDSVELVQVHNIDSTAVCGDNYDRSKPLTNERRHLNKPSRAVDDEKYSSDMNGISAADRVLRSERFIDTTVGIDLTRDDDDDSNGDVTVGKWIFPAPPKSYPEDGTRKLEEANETLQKLIERANKAQKKEEFVDVLDTVFKLTEPLKQWTDKLFDHYEEGLLIEAQRLKSLDELQLTDIPETINLDDDDGGCTSTDGLQTFELNCFRDK